LSFLPGYSGPQSSRVRGWELATLASVCET
jgi:hypothetical protein